MPKNRPGLIKYVTATKATTHDAPVSENNIVGVAVKQKAVASGQGAAGRQNIAVGEQFAIISKGLVEVPVGGLTVAKGTPIYITVASNTLTTTGPAAYGTTNKFGRVVEVPGERGGRTTHMRVDLDDADFA